MRGVEPPGGCPQWSPVVTPSQRFGRVDAKGIVSGAVGGVKRARSRVAALPVRALNCATHDGWRYVAHTPAFGVSINAPRPRKNRHLPGPIEERAAAWVHDRLCGELPAVLADGLPSRAMLVESVTAVVFAQIGGADLQDALGPAFVPKLFRPFHPLIELLD